NAINIVKAIKATIAVKVMGDKARNRGGTVHRGNNANIIAGSYAAGSTVKAHECPAFTFRNHTDFFSVDAELVGMFRGNHTKVMQVHMLSRLNILAGDTNDLAVF